MTEAALVQTFDWVVRFAMLGVVTYAVWVIHREKTLAARLVDKVGFTGSTDVGLKRIHNEDAFLLLPEEQLYCVADGMGGHAAGEVASSIAVHEIRESKTGRATGPHLPTTPATGATVIPRMELAAG